jgi:hypothetical protein
MKTYVSIVSGLLEWAHYQGKFYPISSAPAGAYPISQEQYGALQERISSGDQLGWFTNQRPYATTAWTQPVFTAYTAADGSVISASSDDGDYSRAWRAMDGNTSGGDGNFWCTGNSATGWWQVAFPYKITMTVLVHYNRNNATYANITGRYWTSNAMTTPIGAAFTLATSWGTSTRYNSTANPIITNIIYFQKTAGNGYSGIGEVVITARKLSYEVPE